jgi:hypothetical protein
MWERKKKNTNIVIGGENEENGIEIIWNFETYIFRQKIRLASWKHAKNYFA